LIDETEGWRALHHAQLELGLVGHHARIPFGLKHQIDRGAGDAVNTLDLLPDVLEDEVGNGGNWAQ